MDCCCCKPKSGVGDPDVEILVNSISGDRNDNNEVLTEDRSENGARTRRGSSCSGGSYQSKYMQEIMSGAKPSAQNGATAKLAPGLAQRGKNLEALDGQAEALRRGSINSKKFQGKK